MHGFFTHIVFPLQDQIAVHRPHLKQILQSLANHLESCDEDAANEMMCDFMANRLPPYLENGKADEPKGK